MEFGRRRDTPACISYLVDDAIFVGDTLFMPDYGTARCDFPGGTRRHFIARSSANVRFAAGDPHVPVMTTRRRADEYRWGDDGRGSTREQSAHRRRRQRGPVRGDARGAGQDAVGSRFDYSGRAASTSGGRLSAPESTGVSYPKTPFNLL